MAEPSRNQGQTPLRPKLPLRLGRFILCDELGSGGMATVYLARMELAGGLERLVALKTIHPHLAKEKAFVDMFLDEARIASHVSHPNVCAAYDFGEQDGVYYLAMEYLLGEPLFDVINALVECFDEIREVLPFLAARVIADAADGLHAAHAARGPTGEELHIVHRDVSPQNLFLTYDGSVKVVDFGCAKAAERVAHTSTGVMKGKVGYAAPEQLRADTVEARADIWGLGVCLWEMLALGPLFTRDTAVKTAMAVLQEDIELASEGRSWVPDEVAAIADRALRRDPAERYASAQDMSRDLRQFIIANGYTLESAELGEWMEFLFGERRDALFEKAERARAVEASEVSTGPLYEVQAGDVELLESTPPLEAIVVDEDEEGLHVSSVEVRPGASSLPSPPALPRESLEADGARQHDRAAAAGADPNVAGDAAAVPEHAAASSEAPAVEASTADEEPADAASVHLEAEAPVDEHSERQARRAVAILLALGALIAGGYYLHLFYQPAPWVRDLLGMDPEPSSEVESWRSAARAPRAERGRAAAGAGTEEPRSMEEEPSELQAGPGADDGAATPEEPSSEGDPAPSEAGEGGSGAGGPSSGGPSARGASGSGRPSAAGGHPQRASGGGAGGAGRGGSASASAASAPSSSAAASADGETEAPSPITVSARDLPAVQPAQAEPAADTGVVSISTSSGWAIVYEGSDRLGRTPLRQELPPGRHQLRVLPFGRPPASSLVVNVESGLEEQLTIDIPEGAAPNP